MLQDHYLSLQLFCCQRSTELVGCWFFVYPYLIAATAVKALSESLTYYVLTPTRSPCDVNEW